MVNNSYFKSSHHIDGSAPENQTSYNCSFSYTHPPPNPDISGLGVILGFALTPVITIIILIIFYVCAYRQDIDAIQKDGAEGERAFVPNPLDNALLPWLRKWLRIKDKDEERQAEIQESLYDCIVCMADIQLLTGLAILISGFASLPNGLSAYHWQLVVYLAWLSSLTHLATLTFLRHYLFCQVSLRAWRLVAMFVLIVMLVVALVPTANFDWGNWGDFPVVDDDDDTTIHAYPGSYAMCYLQETPAANPTAYASMIVSVVVLIFSFLTRVVKLYSVSTKALRSLKGKIRSLFAKALDTVRETSSHSETALVRSLMLNLVYHPIRATILAYRCAWVLFSSLLWEIIWLLYVLIWGVLRLSSARIGGNRVDNEWSFGQIVPLILLAALVVSILECMFVGMATFSLSAQNRTLIPQAILKFSDKTKTQSVAAAQHCEYLILRGGGKRPTAALLVGNVARPQALGLLPAHVNSPSASHDYLAGLREDSIWTKALLTMKLLFTAVAAACLFIYMFIGGNDLVNAATNLVVYIIYTAPSSCVLFALVASQAQNWKNTAVNVLLALILATVWVALDCMSIFYYPFSTLVYFHWSLRNYVTTMDFVNTGAICLYILVCLFCGVVAACRRASTA